VTITYAGGNVWPTEVSVDWTSLERIDHAAYVVDGRWELTEAGLRSVGMGYDRLVAIGDVSWTDYEVETTVTVDAIDPRGFQSDAPAVGFVMRWRGHSRWDQRQPRWGYFPLGSIPIYTFRNGGRFEIQGNNNSGFSPTQVVADTTGRKLEPGVTYVFKSRVEALADNAGSSYSLKVWEEGAEEPAGWDLTMNQTTANDLASGSLLLLAHYVDATFGPVTITPL
jgi:hypothetical protein